MSFFRSLFREARTNAMNPVIERSLTGLFSEHEMLSLSTLGTIAVLEPGQRFATEGAVGREAVVVLSGTADVVRDGETIATVGPGAILGERALLTGEPRNATLVAHDELTISVMTQREFSSLLSQCPRLAEEMNTLVLARSAA